MTGIPEEPTHVSSSLPEGKQKLFGGIIKKVKKTFGGSLKNVDVLNGEEFDRAAKDAREGKGRFNFVGEKANLGSALSDLKEAKRLHKGGADMEDVFKKTGWYQDSLDKKWKYELPNNARLTSFEVKPGKFVKTKLENVLDFPDLYAAYPEMKDFSVVFMNLSKHGWGAAFDPKTKTIIIHYGTIGKPIRRFDELRAVVHEVQHYIQDKEGFARGTTPERGGMEKVAERLNENRNRINAIEHHLKGIQKTSPDAAALTKELDFLKSENRALEDDPAGASEYFYSVFAGELESENAENRLSNDVREKGSPNVTRRKANLRNITVRFMTGKSGDVYGFVHDGHMVLNGDKINGNTLLHESSHLFISWVKDNNSPMYRAGLDLMRGSEYLKKVMRMNFYREQAVNMRRKGASEAEIQDFFLDEALARAVGDAGSRYTGSRRQRFVTWLKNFWDSVKESFGGKAFENMTGMEVSRMSFKDFADKVAGRVLRGEELKGEGEKEGESGVPDSRFMSENSAILNDSDFVKDDNGKITGVKPEVKAAIEKERAGIISQAKSDDTYMKTPDGKDTNLDADQWVTVRTKRFKDWFGDWENGEPFSGDFSQMVDENGEPKVFFHRSPNEFTVFDTSMHATSTDAGWLGAGFYFYGVKEESYGYGNKTYNVFLNIRDPYYATNDDNLRLSKENNKIISQGFSDRLKSEGHDGVYYNGDSREEAVAFDPNQIRSISNEGTFGNETGDIRFQSERTRQTVAREIVDESIKAGDKTLEDVLKRGEQENGESLSAATVRAITDAFNERSKEKAKENFYATVAGAKPHKTDRIPVDPIVADGDPIKIHDIIKDVSEGLNQKIFFLNPKRGAAGVYSSADGGIRIKYSGNLDATAHEIGHALDDRYGILKDLKGVDKHPLDKELSKFSHTKAASRPPKGHPDPQAYIRGEGFAEWLRAFVENPDEAIRQAPGIYELYKEKVPENYQKVIKKFSDAVRTWSGMSATDILLSNVRTVAQKPEGVMKKVKNEFKLLIVPYWIGVSNSVNFC